MSENKILVTGSAGFIGFHFSKNLLEDGFEGLGIDNINDYYSPELKEARLAELKCFDNFSVTKEDKITLAGSVFAKLNFRIVNILGYELDFRPEGNMLFLQNKDVPGVIGKVGMILSDSNINIGEYILSRTPSEKNAYSVIKVDNKINSDLFNQLINIDEILTIKQLSI